jgi:hypothetical protein
VSDLVSATGRWTYLIGSGVIVQDNYIVGGFSTDTEEPDETKGNNSVGAMIKVGIAMGPRKCRVPSSTGPCSLISQEFGLEVTRMRMSLLGHRCLTTSLPAASGSRWQPMESKTLPFRGIPSSATQVFSDLKESIVRRRQQL